MNSVKFSIIVPTFNNAQKIKRTIDDLLKIKYDNFEIIIIDDGSTDQTSETLNDLKNSKIKVIKQANKGVSAARNSGIRKASGDYIIFADDDDLVAKNILKTLESAIISNNYPDFIRYSGIRKDADGNSKTIANFRNTQNILDQITKTKNKINCYIWLLAVKNANIKPFREEICYLEDDLFYIDNLADNNKRLVIINDELYTYIYNSQSKTKKLENLLANIDDLAKAGVAMLKSTKLSKKQKKYIKANIVNMTYWRYKDSERYCDKQLSIKIAQRSAQRIQQENLIPSPFLTIKAYIRYKLLRIISLNQNRRKR